MNAMTRCVVGFVLTIAIGNMASAAPPNTLEETKPSTKFILSESVLVPEAMIEVDFAIPRGSRILLFDSIRDGFLQTPGRVNLSSSGHVTRIIDGNIYATKTRVVYSGFIRLKSGHIKSSIVTRAPSSLFSEEYFSADRSISLSQDFYYFPTGLYEKRFRNKILPGTEQRLDDPTVGFALGSKAKWARAFRADARGDYSVKPLHVFVGHPQQASSSVALSPDGNYVALAGRPIIKGQEYGKYSLSIYSIKDRRIAAALDAGFVGDKIPPYHRLLFSPDGSRLACFSGGGSGVDWLLDFYDTKDLSELAKYRFKKDLSLEVDLFQMGKLGHDRWQFTRDGKRLVAWNRNAVIMIDVDTGEKSQVIAPKLPKDTFLTSLRVSSDGAYAFAVSSPYDLNGERFRHLYRFYLNTQTFESKELIVGLRAGANEQFSLNGKYLTAFHFEKGFKRFFVWDVEDKDERPAIPTNWTNKSGESIEATLISVDDHFRHTPMCKFQRPDGTNFEIKLESLDPASGRRALACEGLLENFNNR